jgi:hypothetical protein
MREIIFFITSVPSFMTYVDETIFVVKRVELISHAVASPVSLPDKPLNSKTIGESVSDQGEGFFQEGKTSSARLN